MNAGPEPARKRKMLIHPANTALRRAAGCASTGLWRAISLRRSHRKNRKQLRYFQASAFAANNLAGLVEDQLFELGSAIGAFIFE